jgi:hypothetical protein
MDRGDNDDDASAGFEDVDWMGSEYITNHICY